MTNSYTEWAGYCDSCPAVITLSPRPDWAGTLPDWENWIEPITCPVCWGDLHWEKVGPGGRK